MLQKGINRLLQLSPKIANSRTIKKYLGYLDQGVVDLEDEEVPDLSLLCEFFNTTFLRSHPSTSIHVVNSKLFIEGKDAKV